MRRMRMSKLKIPESWAEITLDDACDLITCGVAAKPNYVENGVPFLSAKNVQNEKVFWKGFKYISKETHLKLSKHNQPKSGDILYTRVGSYGEAAIIDRDDEFSIFVSLTLIKPKQDVLVNTYLKNWLNSEVVKALAKKSITGVGVGNLNVGAVRKFVAPLPPIKEQQRIVAKIESTQEKIKTIESNVAQAEALIEKYRESILQKAFRGQLVPQNPNDESASKLLERIRTERDKLADPKKKKKDDLPPIKPEEIPFEIPKSWEWVRLGEIVSDIAAGWSPQCESRPRKENEWGVLKISSVTWGFFDSDENKALPKKLKPRPELEVFAGDFILSRANTKELVGRGVIVKTTPPKLLLNDKLLRIRFENEILAEYIFYLNNSFIGRSYYEKVASGTSSSMRNLTREDIKKLLVPLPSLNEQLQIVASIQKSEVNLSKLKLSFNCLSAKAKIATNSILENAFSGALVFQNINEGTGHDLLSKIKSESKSPTIKILDVKTDKQKKNSKHK